MYLINDPLSIGVCHKRHLFLSVYSFKVIKSLLLPLMKRYVIPAHVLHAVHKITPSEARRR